MDSSKRAAVVALTLVAAACGGARAPSPAARMPAAPAAVTQATLPKIDTGELRSRMNLPNSCDRGNARACERRCDRGEADACGMLGILVMDGDGVARDAARGVSLFERACSGEDGASCLALAFMSDAGKYVPRDPLRSSELTKKGIFLLERSCNGDDPKLGECFVLARMFEEGKVVPIDRAQAEAIFVRSCDRGDPAMCDQLGVRFADGRWGRDFSRAAALFRKGCDRGFAPSCMNLGILQRDGLGVPENQQAARALLQQACGGGAREACALADPKESARIEAQKTEVRRLFKACEGGDKQACETLRAAKLER